MSVTLKKYLKQRRQTLDSTGGAKDRSEQIAELISQMEQLCVNIEKLCKQRMGGSQSLADQEQEHSAPADDVAAWNLKDSNVRPFAEFYDRLRGTTDSYHDRISKLGKEWARKYNPHYKEQ